MMFPRIVVCQTDEVLTLHCFYPCESALLLNVFRFSSAHVCQTDEVLPALLLSMQNSALLLNVFWFSSAHVFGNLRLIEGHDIPLTGVEYPTKKMQDPLFLSFLSKVFTISGMVTSETKRCEGV
ncbi:hypothetical protein Tco_1066706 [Tanacetum coccineum]|uniref:Uncharacterized protein n=1 Tax=Tanacetum coccineum TaxID=301880 RepID=A0ABQ5HC25_9ASTR